MAQKQKGVADAMIEAEMWNHSSAPFHGGVTGALYRVSGVEVIRSGEVHARRLASQPSAARISETSRIIRRIVKTPEGA